MRNAIKQKDEIISELQKTIETMELSIDEQEQYQRRNSLRIAGIPEKVDENLVERFLKINEQRLGLEISENDIDRIHRVGRPNEQHTKHPRQVLIKFTSYRVRNLVYKRRKLLLRPPEPEDEFDPEIQTEEDAENNEEDDNEDENEETDEDPTIKLFVNEDLTKRRSTLLYKARIQVRAKNISECWSFDGRLFFKDKVNRVHKLIIEQDLNNVINQ